MGGEEIGALFVRIGADVGGLKTGLAEGEGLIGKFGGVLMGIGGILAGAVVGIAAFGVAAVVKTTEAGQAAFEMSEKFGLLPAVASKWINVTKALGLSSDAIGMGFKFLDKNVGSMAITLAAHGKITALVAEPYKVLGLNIFDANHHLKDSNTLMLEAADKFAKMPDGIMKTALAVKIFGRSGADMIPVLNQGSKKLKELMAQGDATGANMSGPQVAAAHKLFLEHQKLDEMLTGITTQVGAFLMPVFISFFGWITAKGVPAIQQLGDYFMKHLWPALNQVWSAAKQLWTAFSGLLAPAIKYIHDNISNLKPVLIAIGITFAVIFGLIVLAIAAVIAIVVVVVAGIVWFAGRVAASVGIMKTIWGGLVGAIKAFASQFWTDVKPIFDWFIPKLQAAADLLGKVGNFLGGTPATGATQQNRPMARALGGPVSAGTTYLVGEHGPEWFTSSTNGTIIPNGGSTESSVDMSATNNLLRALISAVTATPGGQTGVEAALHKAVNMSAMNRARGMAGA